MDVVTMARSTKRTLNELAAEAEPVMREGKPVDPSASAKAVSLSDSDETPWSHCR